MSAIGFGAWPIGGGLGAVEADVGLRAVQLAVDVGQTFIDTAEYYERAHEYGNKTNKQGGSETVIGRALAAAPSLKVRSLPSRSPPPSPKQVRSRSGPGSPPWRSAATARARVPPAGEGVRHDQVHAPTLHRGENPGRLRLLHGEAAD